MPKPKHLILYDGTCGFCFGCVQNLIAIDKNNLFIFAPLEGPTSKSMLEEVPENTLVLIENYETAIRTYQVRGKAVFRVFWLLGGTWKAIGWIAFLPRFLYDWGYRLVAKYRGHLSGGACDVQSPQDQNRFLP